MSDKDKKNDTQQQDANDGGQQSEQVITMTPAQLAERLERAKRTAIPEDYDDLRAAAGKLAELEEAQKTELEKALDRAQKADAERQKALAEANTRLIKAAFIAEAAKHGAAHPEDAFMLADRGGVNITDDGAVSGVAEAVASLLEAGRLPLSGKPKAPNLDAGAGDGNRPDKGKELSPDELEMARKMGVKPEEYAKFR